MSNTFFEVHAVGEIERDIPFPAKHKKTPLSIEQNGLLQLENGESLSVALRKGTFPANNARQLVQWALLKDIHLALGEIDGKTVRIWRVAFAQP